MAYSAMIRVGYEYVRRGLFTEHVPDGECFLSKDGEIQILGTQRIISVPDGPIYIDPYTPAKDIRKIVNREMRKLASLKMVSEAPVQDRLL